VNGVSFDVKQGDYVTIIGHNGSGKSTLAKLIAGLLPVKSGQILIDGKEVNEENIASIRTRLGIVFQNPDNQFIGSTVKDDIAFGLENKLVPSENMDAIINEFAKKVGLEAFLNYEPQNLSGGQKQRVAIAGILAMDPSVLVLDEPTAGLDPSGTASMMKLFSRLNKEMNKTVLIVTHDMEQVFQYCDEVVVVEDGSIRTHMSVQDFFRDSSLCREMNILPPAVIRMRDMLNENGFAIDNSISDIGALARAAAKQVKKHG
jgi:energy-coupling factor transporter ATPase